MQCHLLQQLRTETSQKAQKWLYVSGMARPSSLYFNVNVTVAFIGRLGDQKVMFFNIIAKSPLLQQPLLTTETSQKAPK